VNSTLVVPLNAPNSRTQTIFNFVVLSICLPIILLSFVLEIEGASTVMVPWLDVAIPPTCGMQRSIGLDCPGCGLTRSFVALAHGDLVASIAFNPGGIFVFAFVLFQIPYRIAQLWRIRNGQPVWNLSRSALFFWASIGVVMVTQWLFKLVAYFS